MTVIPHGQNKDEHRHKPTLTKWFSAQTYTSQQLISGESQKVQCWVEGIRLFWFFEIDPARHCVHLTTACTYTNFEMLSHPFFVFLRRSFAKSDFFDVVVSQIGQAKVYKTLKAGKKISACKSLEEEICQIACYFFSLHSLRRSGDCHNIGSRLSLIWVCTRACVLLG
jgi:hypothetical protein